MDIHSDRLEDMVLGAHGSSFLTACIYSKKWEPMSSPKFKKIEILEI